MSPRPALFGALLLSFTGLATASGPVTYSVTVNTSSITGTAGSLDFNFNPGPLATQAASLQILSFASNGTLAGSPTLSGHVAGALPATLTFDNGTGFNDYFGGVTFGSTISFQVSLYGPALSSPDGVSTSGSTFAFSMFSNAAGTTPVLTSNLANGFALTVNVNLDGTTTVTNVSSQAGAGQAVTVTLSPPIVLSPPALSKAFGAANTPLNGTTSLSFTVANPNGRTPLTGVGFTDTLPSGLVVATPNGLTGSCGGAITAGAGSGSVSLSQAVLAAGASCAFSVNITATSVGSQNNTTGAVTSTEAGAGGTASASITVSRIATATSLKAVPTAATLGQSVLLTAGVAPSTATGTVSFLDGSATIGTEQLGAGIASFSTSSLSPGNHSLTASYGGDTNDAPSVSPPVTESVGLQTTTTLLAAAPNPSVAGQNVTLTATVKPGNPTGTVSFFDGASLLGAISLANGVATFPTSSLSTGSHSLTASYSGDANNAPSTSAAVNESVTGGAGSTTPNPVAVSPAFGSGSSQVMSFTFNDPSGWQDLDVVNILINNALDGRNACYLAYSRRVGVLYLVADNGGTLSTGLALGGSGSVSNSQCSVAGAASVASGSGNTLTVTLNLTFTGSFGGNQVVYMAAGDVAGGNSGWQALGVWQVPFTPPGTIAVGSLTPARGSAVSGTAQTFTATLTDSQGTSDFGVVNLLVNNFIDGRNACYLAYVASTNSLLLVDDGGDAGGPFAGGIVLNGAAATIQNSQCSVNGVGSSAAKSGNMLTLTLNITSKSPFAGNRIVWLAGRDAASGNNTGWQAMGTTTVQ